MREYLLWFILASQIGIGIWLIWVKSYVTKKGEDQATKEDIAEITRLVKEVETKYQIDFSRHSLRNELITNVVEAIDEFQTYTDDLAAEYGLERVQNWNISADEKKRIRRGAAKINTVLARLYLTMPDETYKFVVEAVPERVDMIRNMRTLALVSLRTAQFPQSAYLNEKFIRSYSVHM